MKRKRLIVAALLACCFVLAAQTGLFPGPDVPSAIPHRLPSGFFGQSLMFYFHGGPYGDFLPAPVGSPFRTFVTVYNENGTFVTSIVSNPVGQFYSHLKPGNYILLATPTGQRHPPRNFNLYVPNPSDGRPYAFPTNITVVSNQFTQVDVSYLIQNGHF